MEWSGSTLLLVITGRAGDEQVHSAVGRPLPLPPPPPLLLTTILDREQVDTIGMECISAGQLAGSEHTVLVHAKLGLMQGRAPEPTGQE